MYGGASSSRDVVPAGLTEFEILKASHKFLREDDDETDARAKAENADASGSSWGDRLAQKYYASLYREFAVCDLKHYKSGNFALRWRTEEEVLNGAGEETCGNARCPLHLPPPSSDTPYANLKTVELPFAYEEHGERKSALVKVVLCDSCLRKLMWKRERERKEREKRPVEDEEAKGKEKGRTDGKESNRRREEHETNSADEEQERRPHERRKDRHEKARDERRKRHSRSRSPSRHRHRRKREEDRRERSPSS